LLIALTAHHSQERPRRPKRRAASDSPVLEYRTDTARVTSMWSGVVIRAVIKLFGIAQREV
jgi:hypothetical protein